ncbi:hypothetical protein BBP40_007268 [Aspergillus hancockii]|nr:hypothetical protein BBP40_007268 [Aspergillus hancockii]
MGKLPAIKIQALRDPRLALQVPHLTPEPFNKRLPAVEATYHIPALIIVRYDWETLPSNTVMEDAMPEPSSRCATATYSVSGEVYDGHIGPTMSRALSQSLINAVALELGDLYSSGSSPPVDTVAKTIKHAFLAVDNYFVWERREGLLRHIAPESGITTRSAVSCSGSAAQGGLQGFLCPGINVYSQSPIFHVVLAGDSRAVLGRRRCDGDSW